MINQTIQNRFENYLKIQKRMSEYEQGDYTAYIPSTGFGTAVQSGKVSDITPALAINNLELQEQYYQDKTEIEALNRYINSIFDAETKEICILKYCRGWSWNQIARRNNQERTTVSKKIKRHFKKFPTIPA